jgi:thioredoxin-related protein
MKQKTLLFAVAGILTLGLALQSWRKSDDTKPAIETIAWMTWDQAAAAQAKNPKPVMVDVYTDWCGWCKKMDKSTFESPEIVAYMNQHFYAVKFNAEQREAINFSGNEFKYVEAQAGQRGVHELAVAMLDGNMGYPAIVYFTPTYQRIMISPGFKEVPAMNKELKYVQQKGYETKTLEEFSASDK